jgi:malonyl-CoA O-methyltransferase
MIDHNNITIDKKRARQSFDRAVATYDEHAALQRLVVDNMIDSLDIIRIAPKIILDVGAGTGYGARVLERLYPRARTVLLDSSTSMLAYAKSKDTRWRSRQRYLCADAESLPVASASVDFVFSSLTFQWCNDLDSVFSECRRVLKPEGLLLFSSLGPDTLRELRDAWSAVDHAPHINQFIDMHDVGDAMIRAGFASPVLECEITTVNYDDVFGLVRDLRGIGAVNSLRGRRRGLSSRTEIKQMSKQYEEQRRDGKLPATYEVVYGHAWRPMTGDRVQDGSTVATFPFADIQRRP